MATWHERYTAGEYAEVWAEMQALGPDIRKAPHRKASQAVARETMNRAAANTRRLFQELLSLGYRFQGAPEPAEPDYPLELRLEHALQYVEQRGGRKYKAQPWSHPALAWVDEEDIELPARFRKGNPGRANYCPPGPRLLAALDEVERRAGRPLPLAVRCWFETVGSVNLRGAHPVLNRDGAIEALDITLENIDPAAGGETGAEFVAGIRRAFAWAGFPGWSGRQDAPERELAWLRSKLLPL